jgi:inner membrane protein
MPSALSHPVPALAIAADFGRARLPRAAIIAGVACSLLPDIDLLWLRLGIAHGSILGHRGLTHSLPFALALGVVMALIVCRRERRTHFSDVCLYLFLATASHGMFDALTNGGSGVAFFAPLSSTRYFFAFRPIEVSPLSVARFLSDRGWVVLKSELPWVWLPSLVFAAVAILLRQRILRRHSTA